MLYVEIINLLKFPALAVILLCRKIDATLPEQQEASWFKQVDINTHGLPTPPHEVSVELPSISSTKQNPYYKKIKNKIKD